MYNIIEFIKICRRISETYENSTLSVTGDFDPTLSGQIVGIETVSMTSGADLNISQLSILLRILRHKLGVKIFEPEKEMKELYVEIIQPDFGEYMNYYKVDIKPEPFLILGV